MTGEPLWNEVATEKIVTVMRFSVPKNAGPSTVDEPTIEQETRSKEDIDLPWQVVVHNDPRQSDELRDNGVSSGSSVTRVRKPSAICWRCITKGVRSCGAECASVRELYVQQLHGYLLLATLEKAG